MNIHELEGVEELATKKDLEVLNATLRQGMAEIRADLHREINIQTRWMMGGIWGLYALILLSHFWK